MNAKDMIQNANASADMIRSAYLGDLSDADLLLRPVPGQNHIAWQLGHLINSERQMVESIQPGASPVLPDGFDEAHGKETTGVDDLSKFYPKARYLEFLKAQGEATQKVLASLSEADLDKPTDERFRAFAPTVGALMLMISTHTLMHVGQFVSVRRQLGKPVAI